MSERRPSYVEAQVGKVKILATSEPLLRYVQDIVGFLTAVAPGLDSELKVLAYKEGELVLTEIRRLHEYFVLHCVDTCLIEAATFCLRPLEPMFLNSVRLMHSFIKTHVRRYFFPRYWDAFVQYLDDDMGGALSRIRDNDVVYKHVLYRLEDMFIRAIVYAFLVGEPYISPDVWKQVPLGVQTIVEGLDHAFRLRWRKTRELIETYLRQIDIDYKARESEIAKITGWLTYRPAVEVLQV